MTLVPLGRPTRAESERTLRVAQSRASGKVARSRKLPEYLDQPEVEALIDAAPHPDCQLLMLLQWRGGLRVSEALAVEVGDLYVDQEPPVLKVRQGKGGKDRLVPVHPELLAALQNHLRYRRMRSGRLVTADKSTVWRWYKRSAKKAQGTGGISGGRRIATHTLRHSAARHWLACGVPINQVSMWLGHASIQTTLVYLQLLPDPSNWMERVS